MLEIMVDTAIFRYYYVGFEWYGHVFSRLANDRRCYCMRRMSSIQRPEISDPVVPQRALI